MTTVLLLRHGRTAANAAGLLAGWTEGVGLDGTGQEQVTALGRRLRDVPLAGVVTSPLQRCRETTDAIVSGREVEVTVDEGVGECHYGGWTNRPLKELAKEDLWRTVQDHPSAATFPASEQYRHESIAQMQLRAVETMRHYDAHFEQQVGAHAVWALVSHGDVIKSILAECLGEHIDQFQRITVGPASLSAVRLTATRPFVLRINDTGSDPADLVPKPDQAKDAEATVGGGSTAQG